MYEVGLWDIANCPDLQNLKHSSRCRCQLHSVQNECFNYPCVFLSGVAITLGPTSADSSRSPEYFRSGGKSIVSGLAILTRMSKKVHSAGL